MPSDTQANPSDHWSVYNGTNNGKPIIISYNAGLGKQFPYGDPKLPFRAGVAILFLAPEKSGFPKSDELIIFEKIEDRLSNYLQSHSVGVLAAVVTTNGMREFMMYVKSEDQFKGLVKDLAKAFPKYQVTHYVEEDSGWTGYRFLVPEK